MASRPAPPDETPLHRAFAAFRETYCPRHRDVEFVRDATALFEAFRADVVERLRAELEDHGA